MNQRYNILLKRLGNYKTDLKGKKIDSILKDVSSVTYEFMQPRRRQDILKIFPYDSSVSTKYNCSYVNASFIDLPGCKFIACQLPQSKYVEEFQKFLTKANIKVILSLNSESINLLNHEPYTRKQIDFNNKPFLYDELYVIDTTKIRRIHCVEWKDHGVMTVEQMEFLYVYMENVYKELNIKTKKHVGKKEVMDYIESIGKDCKDYKDYKDCKDCKDYKDCVNKYGTLFCENRTVDRLENSYNNDSFLDEYHCVVHCRAGVGRTGTYIFYKILKDLIKVNEDEFLKIFLYLRSLRPYMVENVEQFNFLVKCFL